MKLALGLLISVFWFLSAVAAQEAPPESEFRDRFCAGFEVEVTTPLGRRADCQSGTHAIEVGWSFMWAESLGQALAYAYELAKKPGLILVCVNDPQTCQKHSLLTEATLAHFRVRATVWECLPTDQTLNDCLRKDIGEFK